METGTAKKDKRAKSSCKKKSKTKSSHNNGKGDAPRNNQSDKFRNNFDKINWSSE